MPVVRGDRIGESQKLNRRGVEAQDFYAALVAAVPDDFGRFRLSAGHVAMRLYPRRELTAALLRRVERLLAELGGGEDPLWRTWECDGVVYAEFTSWRATGNRYHRTPEPPWSQHLHNGACMPTAIARARDVGDQAGADALSRRLRELRERRRSETGAGAERTRYPSSPPSPSSPYYPPPPAPPAAAGGEIPGPSRQTAPAPEPGADVCTDCTDPAPASDGDRRARKRRIRDAADAAERYWAQLGGRPSERDRKGIRDRLRAGYTLAQVQGSISERVRDELVARGALSSTAVWPPPGLAPFDPPVALPEARASPTESDLGEKAWGGTREALRAKLSPQAWATWIRPCRGLYVREGRVVVEVPDARFLDWIGRNWSAHLQWAAAEAGLGGVNLVVASATAIAG